MKNKLETIMHVTLPYEDGKIDNASNYKVDLDAINRSYLEGFGSILQKANKRNSGPGGDKRAAIEDVALEVATSGGFDVASGGIGYMASKARDIGMSGA